MNARQIVFQLDFPDPEIVSTLSLYRDQVNVTFNSFELFKCAGHHFHDSDKFIVASIPTQASETEVNFLAESKKSIDQSKKAMLAIKVT